jgi:hypothetical protein
MEEVVKLLGDKGYETSGLTGCEPDFLSRLIAADRAQVASLIAAAGKGLFDLFLYPNDYHNIKVALKNELTDEPRDIFTAGGSIPTEVMKAAVETVRSRPSPPSWPRVWRRRQKQPAIPAIHSLLTLCSTGTAIGTWRRRRRKSEVRF